MICTQAQRLSDLGLGVSLLGQKLNPLCFSKAVFTASCVRIHLLTSRGGLQKMLKSETVLHILPFRSIRVMERL